MSDDQDIVNVLKDTSAQKIYPSSQGHVPFQARFQGTSPGTARSWLRLASLRNCRSPRLGSSTPSTGLRLPCCFRRTMLRPSPGSQARLHAFIEYAPTRVRHTSTGSAVVSRSFVKCGKHGCHELRARTSCAMPGQGDKGNTLHVRLVRGVSHLQARRRDAIP
jgi:hypothetical protein